MSGVLTMRCGTWQMETKWSLKIFISCPHSSHKTLLKEREDNLLFSKMLSFGNLNLKVIFITMKMTTLVNWKSNLTKYKFNNTPPTALILKAKSCSLVLLQPLTVVSICTWHDPSGIILPCLIFECWIQKSVWHSEIWIGDFQACTPSYSTVVVLLYIIYDFHLQN